MKIQCTDKRTFELTDGSEKLGYITYDGLFSFKANAVLGDDKYRITPVGIFSTTISVARDEVQVAALQMNWKGHVIISFQDGREYVLKPAGNFLSKYVLEDKGHQKLMLLDPDFNWSKFSYNYDITYDQKPKDALLVLLATYAANYYVAATSSAMM